MVTVQVFGTFAILIPQLSGRIKEWAYAGFVFNFIFASISHFAVDGLDFQSFLPLFFLGILIVSYTSCHQ